MENKIIDKINSESDMLNLLIERRNILRSELSQIQTQIERKNGAILSLKELLEQVQAEEHKKSTKTEDNKLE